MKNNNSFERTVLVSECSIKYTLTIKKVKNINLRIKSDGSICVSANRYIPKNEIDNFVQSNADFIAKATARLSAVNNLGSKERLFINGDIITIFGRTHILEIIFSKEQYCEILDDKIFLYCKEINKRDKKAAIFYKFIDSLLLETTHSISKKHYPKLIPLGAIAPTYKIRNMRSRYGSCKKSTGNITVNRQVIAAPISAIDYLICHELAHLIIANHSKDFYSLLSKLCPNYKNERSLLREYGCELI